MELDEHLSELRADGDYDSTGQFTVAFTRASRVMGLYSCFDPYRYILWVVSGALGRGTSRIDIVERKSILELRLEGFYALPDRLTASLSSLQKAPYATHEHEFVMGLAGAMTGHNDRVELEVVSPTRASYSWSLTPDEEHFEPLARGPSRALLRIYKTPLDLFSVARRWLKGLGGYAELGPECRWIDSKCEFAQTPIYIDGQQVNRQYYPPGAASALVVGDFPKESLVYFELLELKAKAFESAVLTPGGGVVNFVVRGIVYLGPTNLGVSGLVYCDNLRLDISRQGVVENFAYHALITELKSMLFQLAKFELEVAVKRGLDESLAYSILSRLSKDEDTEAKLRDEVRLILARAGR